MTRRTSNRKRRRIWTRALLIVLAAGMFFGGREVYLALAARAEPTVDSHRLLEDLVWADHPGISRSENAWPVLEDLGEMLRRTREAASAEKGPDGEPADLFYQAVYETPEELADRLGKRGSEESERATQHLFLRGVARRAMERHRKEGMFDLTARLADAAAVVRPRGAGPVFDMELHELDVMRTLLQVQMARFHEACESHDDAEAIRAVRESLAMGRIASRQASMVDRSAGQNMTRGVLRVVRRRVTTGDASPAMCAELMTLIGDGVGMPPLARAIEGGRIGALDLVQWTHTKEGWGGGRRLVAEVARLLDSGMVLGEAQVNHGFTTRLANFRGAWLPRKNAVDAAVNVYFDEAVAASKLTGAEREAAFAALDKRRGSFGSGNDEYASMVLWSLGMLPVKDDLLEMEAGGTRVALAIEVFRAEKARLPLTLNELVPDLLDELPPDPFASDGAFVYQPAEETAAGSFNYSLYSVGPDRTDNQGRSDPKDPWLSAWWKDGLDFVINAPGGGEQGDGK